MSEASTTTTEFVLRREQQPLDFFGMQTDPRVWWFIVGLVLIVGFFYIGWMYFKDSRGVGWKWASLLGLLRACVYLLLAAMFMLPARQTWHESNAESKVIVLFDVSDSMTQTKDDFPQPGQTLATVPVRQAKVFDAFTKNEFGFFKELARTNPMDVYRFSRSPDREFRRVGAKYDESGELTGTQWWSREEWEQRLSQIAKKEKNPIHGRMMTDAQWKSWLFPRTDVATKPLPEEKKAQPDEKQTLTPQEQKKAREERLRQALAQRNASLVNGGELKATNVGESLLAILKKEASNLVQGIVIISDGKSTEGSSRSIEEVSRIAEQANIPIFVVAVGKDRPKVSIEITDIRVPPQIRPEDKFRVVASVNGPGMEEESFPVFLEVTRVIKNDEGEVEEQPIVLVGLNKNGDIIPDVKINLGRKVTLDKRFVKQRTTDGRQEVPNPPKFLKGNPPNAQIEFEIDARILASAMNKTLDENIPRYGIKPDPKSEMRFHLRIPKDKREITADTVHISNPADMYVLKKTLRILLFASVASREYQFVRSLMVREMDKNRAEVSIYLQPLPGQPLRGGIVQGVPNERLLDGFPTRRKLNLVGNPTQEAKLKSLSSYDLIIAFDPDWLQLTPNQRKNLREWVVKDGGGLIVVASKLNMIELSRPTLVSSGTIDAILQLLPVVVDFDKLSAVYDSSRAYRLQFEAFDPAWEFLRLEEDDPKIDAQDSWNRFFNGYLNDSGEIALRRPEEQPERGFYRTVPVKSVKENAIVIARLPHPDLTIVDRRDNQRKNQPFLVLGNNGQGKVIWIGSGEMWRLRMHKESYHERFWTKLARFAGSGSLSTVTKTITPVMSRNGVKNKRIIFEGRFEGFDGKALPRDTEKKPKLYITLPAGTPPKKGDRVELNAQDNPKLNGRRGLIKRMLSRDGKDIAEIVLEGEAKEVVQVEASKVDVLIAPLVLKPRMAAIEGSGGKDENDGWFKVEYRPPASGEYKMELKNESTGEVYTHSFIVKDSNPELDDVRPDVAQLYALASPAESALSRVSAADKARVMAALQPPSQEKKDDEEEPVQEKVVSSEDEMRLYFKLNNADLIPKFMEKRVEQYRDKGATDDLWDDGFVAYTKDNGEQVIISWALCAIVGLLSLEWLIRKLIRLA